MGELHNALSGLLSSWHGRKHGAVAHLAKVLQADTGVDAYKRLLREIPRSPTSWEVVEWTVHYCAPPDAPTGWEEQELERFAGLFHRTYDSMPPGYTGRVRVDEQIIREPLHSSADTDEPLARLHLLQREREEIEEAKRVQQRQVQELADEIESLRKRNVALLDDNRDAGVAFSTAIETLTEHVERVRQETRANDDATARLLREIADLQNRELSLRRERDEARQLADERYAQLQAVRLEADRLQGQLRQHIVDLQWELTSLIRTSTPSEPPATAAQLETLRREVLRLRESTGEQPGDRPVPAPRAAGTEAGEAYQWMDPDWFSGRRPDETGPDSVVR